MFQSLNGFKTQYHYLTLLVVSEFNEWKVLICAPELNIQVPRQFTEAKAKESAVAAARSYIHDEKQEELPVLTDITWAPTSRGDWLLWRG